MVPNKEMHYIWKIGFHSNSFCVYFSKGQIIWTQKCNPHGLARNYQPNTEACETQWNPAEPVGDR